MSRSERDAASIGHPILDFGLRISELYSFFNPHSTIGNPHFGYPPPVGAIHESPLRERYVFMIASKMVFVQLGVELQIQRFPGDESRRGDE